MAGEIINVTVTEPPTTTIEVDVSTNPPSVTDVFVDLPGGFTFVQAIEPEATAVGQTWFDTSDNSSYVWFGGIWTPVSASGGGGITFVQDTIPTATNAGETWFDTSTGLLYIWYVDTDSSQWINVGPSQPNGFEIPDVYAKGQNTAFAMAQNTNGVVWMQSNQVDPYNIIPTSGGIMTVPVDGFYSVSVSIQVAAFNNASVNFWIYNTRTGERLESVGWMTSAAAATQHAMSTVMRLEAGDTFYVGYWTTSSGVTFNDGKIFIQLVNGLYTASIIDSVPEPWNNVTFLNSWSNYGGGWEDLQYRKLGDIVQLRGMIKHPSAGSGTNICTLPVGYRPPKNLMFSGEGYTTNQGYVQIRVDVMTTGSVHVSATTLTGVHQYLSLSGIQFSVTP